MHILMPAQAAFVAALLWLTVLWGQALLDSSL